MTIDTTMLIFDMATKEVRRIHHVDHESEFADLMATKLLPGEAYVFLPKSVYGDRHPNEILAEHLAP